LCGKSQNCHVKRKVKLNEEGKTLAPGEGVHEIDFAEKESKFGGENVGKRRKRL